MLTEAEVHRSFNTIFKNEGRTPEAFDKAEQLLEQLRAESPLRHRLSVELEELRSCRRRRSDPEGKGVERRQRFRADAARARIAFPR